MIFYIRAIPRLGLPALRMSDGPMGVHDYGETTAYPAGIALAASWDMDLARRVGISMGQDARARGVHFILAPEVLAGWVVGWKKSKSSETTPCSLPRTPFWIVSELATIRPESPALPRTRFCGRRRNMSDYRVMRRPCQEGDLRVAGADSRLFCVPLASINQLLQRLNHHEQ
jgi:Glycosyl hydrolase family 3 N terminal domain